jgi:four helix bundle protein
VEIREYRGTGAEGATQYFTRKSGQLIYGKQNIFRGAIGIIPEELDGYASSQDIPSFDICDSVGSDWLYWYMSRPSFYEKLEHFAAGSGSKRLHPRELFKIEVKLPPLEQQRGIANILNTASKEITLLKNLADKYCTQKRGLMQKLLTGEWRVKSLTIDHCALINNNCSNACKWLTKKHKRYVPSKQLLRCGTSISANVSAELSAKTSIAYKEYLEMQYWLKFLKDMDFLDKKMFESIFHDADELGKILFSIVRSARQ